MKMGEIMHYISTKLNIIYISFLIFVIVLKFIYLFILFMYHEVFLMFYYCLRGLVMAWHEQTHLRMCKLEKRGGGSHARHELTHLRMLHVSI